MCVGVLLCKLPPSSVAESPRLPARMCRGAAAGAAAPPPREHRVDGDRVRVCRRPPVWLRPCQPLPEAAQLAGGKAGKAQRRVAVGSVCRGACFGCPCSAVVTPALVPMQGAPPCTCSGTVCALTLPACALAPRSCSAPGAPLTTRTRSGRPTGTQVGGALLGLEKGGGRRFNGV